MKRLDAVLGKVHLPSWCFIVVRHGGNVTKVFIVFCPSEESPQTYILSSTNTFFQCLAGWDPVYIQSTLWDIFPLPWGSQVLVWHHCHHAFTSSYTRQSRPLLFFPRGCIFSMVTTIVCCLCHLVRVTFTIAVGKVAKIARRCPPGLSRCCATHFGSP